MAFFFMHKMYGVIIMIKISELKSRDVINIADGRKIGYVKDIELDMEQGVVTALVIPGESNVLKLFFRSEDIVIPWAEIDKIGDDVILVDLKKLS